MNEVLFRQLTVNKLSVLSMVKRNQFLPSLETLQNQIFINN